VGVLEQAFRDAIAAAAAGDDSFVTLESVRDPNLWVQITADSINAFYPRATEPPATLAALSIVLPDGVALISWEADMFATFEHRGEPLPDLVRFVEQYLSRILGITSPDTTMRAG
jgi:hypothetical protein